MPKFLNFHCMSRNEKADMQSLPAVTISRSPKPAELRWRRNLVKLSEAQQHVLERLADDWELEFDETWPDSIPHLRQGLRRGGGMEEASPEDVSDLQQAHFIMSRSVAGYRRNALMYSITEAGRAALEES
jgi:DNA-binding PadR family transcriptional regulator